MTQAEKFKEIANAIRKVEDRTDTYTISANDFAKEIDKLDPKLNAHASDFENGYYGLRAAKCASTYLLARVLGHDKFVYHNTNIFSQSTTPYVRDKGGYGRIDCSAFVGLCLRGITYDKSPYEKHKNVGEQWTPAEELPAMYGTEGWEFKELDFQPHGVFNDIGITNYSTVRFAADLGRYFHKYGRVLYEKTIDGEINNHKELGLQPGDLIFWDTSDKINVDGRFKSISHVAMVAENTDYYYHVTGTSGVPGTNVIYCIAFSDSDTHHPTSDIVLVVRPDYRPRMTKEETPSGVNLLEYPWTYSRGASYTKNGITVTLVDKHSVVIDGTATAATTIELKNTPDSGDHITLSAGTYQLTGIEGFTGISFALQVRDVHGNDFDTPVRFPTGSSATNVFTLTEETDVTVRLYISSGQVLSNVVVTPTLIRVE